MEKKKSNTGLIITIVILIIFLLGAAGYICYDKFLTSDENNPLDDSKKVETKPKEEEQQAHPQKKSFLKKIFGL